MRNSLIIFHVKTGNQVGDNKRLRALIIFYYQLIPSVAQQRVRFVLSFGATAGPHETLDDCWLLQVKQKLLQSDY